MSSDDIDIDEMLSKISEKLGWLELGDVDTAISSLRKKQRPKKSTKKGHPTTTTTKKNSSTSNSTTTSSSSTLSKVKLRGAAKKQDVPKKSDVRSAGARNTVNVTRDCKKNVKTDLPDGTGPKAVDKILHVGSDSKEEEEKKQLAAMTTRGSNNSSDMAVIGGNNNSVDNNENSNDDNNNNNNNDRNINDGHKDYNDKLGRDKMSSDTTIFFPPSKPLSPSHRYSNNSSSNSSSSLRNQSDLSPFDDSTTIGGICKISFMSDDSTAERSLNNSDTVSGTSNTGNAVGKSPLTTIQTPPTIAETVKSSVILNTPVSIAKPSLAGSVLPERHRGACPSRSSVPQLCINGDFGEEGDGSSKDTGGCCSDSETQQQTPTLTNNTPMSRFTVEEFFIFDDDDDDDDGCVNAVDCDDDNTFLEGSPTNLPRHQHISDIKTAKLRSNDSAGSVRTPLADHNERRCQSEFRHHKYYNNNNNNIGNDYTTGNSNVESNKWKSRKVPSVSLSTDSSDSDDDDEDNNEFEAFLAKMKTPARKKPTTSPMSMEVFIVSDSESSSSGGSDSDNGYSISLYHRTRPDCMPFGGTFSSNQLPSVHKEKPHRSDLCEKRPDRTAEPTKVGKPKAKAGKHDNDDDDDDKDVFRKPTSTAATKTPTGSSSAVTRLKTPILGKKSTPMLHNMPPNILRGGKVLPPQTCPTLKYFRQPPPPPPPILHQTNKRSNGDGHTSFLTSLSENAENQSYFNEEARKYVKYFKKHQVELVKRLFKIYNETIFDSKFPADFPVRWNKRLLTTAGHCKLKSRAQMQRSAEVNLATKVCDTAERVRDTLIHELCHAAVWLFNGSREGHGQLWQSWARRANRRYPSALPVIKRCHSYNIAKKYTYKCVRCGYSFGRHSKSLDTTKKVCGYCHGHFVLVTPAMTSTNDSNKTPARTPNKFALFVKEHYSTVKKTNVCSHKDVMNILSQKFKQTQIS